MQLRPTYQRTVRIPDPLPGGTAQIPVPPAPEDRPGLDPWDLILPVVMGLLTAALLYLIMPASQRRIASWWLFSFPITPLGSGLIQWLRHNRQRRKDQHEYQAAMAAYEAELAALELRLEQDRRLQAETALRKDPNPAQCLAMASAAAEGEKSGAGLPALWSRAPHHDDFLTLRLGAGERPFLVEVRPQQGHPLVGRFRTVPGLPVCLPMSAAGPAAIAGPPAKALAVVRALAIQLGAHHAPDEVKLATLLRPDQAELWSGLRWLPHVWSDDRQSRYMAASAEEARLVLAHLCDLIRQRRGQTETSAPFPQFVCLADASMLDGPSPCRTLFVDGPAAGIFTLLLAERHDQVPPTCTHLIDLARRPHTLIELVSQRSETPFEPDLPGPELLEAMGRALAPLRLHGSSPLSEGEPVLVTVSYKGAETGFDLRLPPDLPAVRLADLLGCRGARIEAHPPGRLLDPGESLAQAGAWDGSWLVLHGCASRKIGS
ncbi:MAG TPA: hypothetical protein VD902_16825 [Symbiobacteriaceae bacterium]|nr:hypothetical protein [Symbiobacteriaceae bacterium]